MKRTLFLLATAAFATIAQAEKPFDPEREGVVVIGLRPDTISVSIGEGKISGEQRWKSTRSRATFVGLSKGGYIVTRVPAGKLMAIRSVRPRDLSRSEYWFCATAFTPTFIVPAGKVLYLGEFTYKWPSGLDPWLLTGDADVESARRYVDANFESLAGKVESGTFQMMRTRTNCSAKNGALSYQ